MYTEVFIMGEMTQCLRSALHISKAEEREKDRREGEDEEEKDDKDDKENGETKCEVYGTELQNEEPG